MEIVAPGGVLHGSRGRMVTARTITSRLLRISGLKRCYGCKLVLPEDAFVSNRSNRDGLSNACAECNGGRPAPADANAKHARWRAAHPATYRAWAVRNAAKRRARLRGVHVEDVDPRALFERDEGLCGICGDPVDRERFDVDHIVPLAQGGEHSYANTQIAHVFCNRSKGGVLGAAITNAKEAVV